MLGVFFVIGGICSFINGSASLGWQGLIVGIIVAVVPQALTIWGAEVNPENALSISKELVEKEEKQLKDLLNM